jgi:gluconolactonase
MKAEQIAEGLSFPEGPVWDDGSLYFTEIALGRVCRWTASGGVATVAETGGGPNGATPGPDGSLYIAQNGGLGRESRFRLRGSIQKVGRDGRVEIVASTVDGLELDAPNDLAFGPDGRLYFTDPRGEPDPARNRATGRLYALDVGSRRGQLLREVGPSYPNGIGFDPAGILYWVESFTRKVLRLVDGRIETVLELPERHNPDGFCFDAAGRMYIASTYAHCVSVVDRGRLLDRIVCHEKGMVTNCCFGGTDLYVTESRFGTLWRIPIGVEGLPLPAFH